LHWTVDTLFYTHSFQQCLPKFVFAIFQSIDWLKHNEGGGVPSLSKANIEKIQTAVPRIPEQQKIADCLSSLDELIAAQACKVDALKIQKKGLMQQLFPREGETQPRLRFQKFLHAGEWQKRKISALLTKSVRPVNVDSGATYREIGIRSHGKGIFHKEPISGKAIGDKRVFWVADEALVLNIVFAWEQAVAVTSLAEKGMIASHRFPMYSPRSNKAHVHFLKYFFLSEKGRELLGIASPGGAGRNKTLGQKDFENLEFWSPCTVDEQKEIANTLSSLDTLISIQCQNLESLNAHKKGLMQQLFPSAEVVKA
jgi:type I restriction enzyme S subunit